MQIVIDIPEETYTAMVNNLGFGAENETMLYSLLYRSVVNGTPIPKRHGRLIDAYAVEKTTREVYGNCMLETKSKPIDFVNILWTTPTILEAESED